MQSISPIHPSSFQGRILLIASLLLLMLVPTSPAEEPASQFLEGLRERRYYDVALDYLEQMRASMFAPAEFRREIDYHRGVVLLDLSKIQRDARMRNETLNEARKAFEKFLADQPHHKLALSVSNQLGVLLVERAEMKVDQAKKRRGPPATLRAEAQTLYQQARGVFTKNHELIVNRLKRFKKSLDPQRDKSQIEQRNQLRADLLQTLLLNAHIVEDMAETFTKGSADFRRLLTEAVALHKEIYKDYRLRLAGQYARMHQGRCYAKLGDHAQALSNYMDILENDDPSEEFRLLKRRTLALAVESWFDRSQKKYPVAVKNLKAWVDSARPNETRHPEALFLRLSMARAMKLQADELSGMLEKNQTAPRDEKSRLSKEIRVLLADAKQSADEVSKITSDYQDEAKKLLVELGGPDRTVADKQEQVKTFTQAYDRGKELLNSFQTAQFTVSKLPETIQKEQDEKTKKELEKQLAEAHQTLKTAPDEAIGYFQQALRLADAQTEIDDVNIARYFLTFLYIQKERYFDAAVLSEFVARRYPQSAVGKHCAQFALAAYYQLYQQAEKDKSFEAGQIVSVAEYITQAWPGQPEALDALNTLISFAVTDGRIEKALEYLAKVPQNHSQRGASELKTGQALWSAYLSGLRKLRSETPEGAEMDNGKLAELEQRKQQAEQILTAGVDRMRKAGGNDPSLATAIVSLCQLFVDTGRPTEAVRWLEDAQIGALTLIKQKHPSTKKPGVAVETYKTALRAYISSLSAAPNEATVLIAKAKNVMQAMKQTIARSPNGQKELIGIYVSLAKDLQTQMEKADAQQKQVLSSGFETFLTQVGQDAQDLEVLIWVAETFRSMGEELLKGAANPGPQAAKYLQQAVAAYGRILKKSESNAGFLDSRRKTEIQIRLAMAKRSQGSKEQFRQAVDIFQSVLQEQAEQKKTPLNVQIEAARTYQQWGRIKNANPDLYKLAMSGARKDKTTGRNVIWGWSKISQRTARNKNFQNEFYESCYNLALCSYEYALRQSNASLRRQWLMATKRNLTQLVIRFPTLGGPKWRPHFDHLAKRVQKELGENEGGLEALKPKKKVAQTK